MGKVLIYLRIKTPILGSINTENQMDLDNTNGRTKALILENSKTD
jgi:hypothetical protein